MMIQMTNQYYSKDVDSGNDDNQKLNILILKLCKYWKKNNNLSLGQIILNLLGEPDGEQLYTEMWNMGNDE